MSEWRPLLDVPWNYPERFLVAAFDPETWEVGVFVCEHGGHGWLYPTPYGERDRRGGLPLELAELGWRAYAWCEPLPPDPGTMELQIPPGWRDFGPDQAEGA